MIARHETTVDTGDIWAQLSAPLPTELISWRQDGRAVQRDGRFFARFVAYVDANTVRERLDAVVPGEWDLTLELLPTIATDVPDEANCSFKARLQILGVIREDVGTGRDYKSAATDAFKRAAVRYGIAHELYAYEQNWVRVDGDGRYAKPLEDPAESYARRLVRIGRGEVSIASDAAAGIPRSDRDEVDGSTETPATMGPLASDEPSCPKCGGRMWDNRLSKRSVKAPDYKCRSRSCDGVIWPTRAGGKVEPAEASVPEYSVDASELPF